MRQKKKPSTLTNCRRIRSGTSYLYENGQKVTGLKTFDDVTYYFYDDGRQAKGTEVTINGKTYQFDQLTGIMTRNAFSKSYNYEGSPRFPYYPTRYYGNAELLLPVGKPSTARTTTSELAETLKQDVFLSSETEPIMLMTMVQSLTARVNQLIAIGIVYDKGDNYYYNDKGEKVTGFQEVDGKVLYFDAEGKQVLGRFVTVDNYTYYFDPKNR